jgi:uncharacterized protein YbjT (DUF2867 family)
VILVAGATGHLGTELVPLLLGRGESVRVLTRDPGRARGILGPEVELVQGDVRDPGSLAAAVDGVSAVVSALTGFGPGADGVVRVDRDGNLNLIGAAEGAGVGCFVLLSMAGAAPDHPLELLRMKHAAEERLRSSRLAWTIVRPTVFLELWAGIVGDPIARTGRTVVFGRGDNPVNFVAEADIARLIELALGTPGLRGRVVEIGGPHDLTVNQLIAAVESVTGRKASVRHLPLPVLRAAATVLRPFRPDLAGMVQAGILMDTRDMSLEPAYLPGFVPTPPLEVIRRRFGAERAAATKEAGAAPL